MTIHRSCEPSFINVHKTNVTPLGFNEPTYKVYSEIYQKTLFLVTTLIVVNKKEVLI